MKTRKVLFGVCFLTWFCLSACTSSQTPSLLENTSLPKTLIPERAEAAPSLSLTPKPLDILVTTRAGQEVHFERIMIEPNEYVAFHTESIPQGIPLANGVEVKLDYLQQVDFVLPTADWEKSPAAGVWKVDLLLTDGTQLHTALGFKARHKLRVTGYSNLGYVEIDLIDVKKITFQRSSAPLPLPLPKEPVGNDILTVGTQNGEIVRVANPKIFTRCMYEVYCCHDETLEMIPLLGRTDIALNAVQSVTFPSNQSVVIASADGSPAAAKIRPSSVCPQTAWRLRGKAALGDFEIELSSVKEMRK
jgi:hypothetical protein